MPTNPNTIAGAAYLKLVRKREYAAYTPEQRKARYEKLKKHRAEMGDAYRAQQAKTLRIRRARKREEKARESNTDVS